MSEFYGINCKLFRYLIDCGDTELSKDFIKRVLNSDVTDLYFDDYDPKSNSFSTTAFSMLFNFCKSYYETYAYPPTDDTISLELLGHSELSTFEKAHIQEVINDIKEHEPKENDFLFLLDQVREEYLKNSFLHLTQKAVAKVKDSPKVALDFAMRGYSELLSRTSVSEDIHEQTLWSHQLFQHYYDMYKSSGGIAVEKIPFGYLEWDMKLGGMTRGSLNVICGPPGTGKSFLGHDIAFFLGFEKNYNVVIIERELTYDEIMVRFFARQTGIPINRLSNLGKHQLSTEDAELLEKTMLQFMQRKDNNVLILPSERCVNVAMMKREIEAHFGDVKPDFILVDYINEVKPMRNYSSDWEAIREITSDLKSMAIYFNAAMLTMTQPNSKGYNNVEAGMSEVGYKSIVQKAAIIIFIMPDPDAPFEEPEGPYDVGEPGILICNIPKSRNSAKTQFRLLVNYAVASLVDAPAFGKKDKPKRFKRKSEEESE